MPGFDLRINSFVEQLALDMPRFMQSTSREKADTPWDVMEKAGFVEGWVLPWWDKIVEMIRANPDRLPF